MSNDRQKNLLVNHLIMEQKIYSGVWKDITNNCAFHVLKKLKAIWGEFKITKAPFTPKGVVDYLVENKLVN